MGLSSTSTSNEGVRICIFDLRRGEQEGQEIDKILFFFPFDYLISAQLSMVGLSEGLITFTRIFSPDAACEVIEAEKHSHVFYQAEADIWMVMVVEKSKESETIWRTAALRGVLKEMHSLFVMFHGSIRALLDREPDGALVRCHLHSFISDYLSDLLVGKKLQIPFFRDCLREGGTIQMLTVGREAAIEVQSFVRMIESCCATTNGCHSLILFQDLLVSTTLPPDDAANLYAYAVSRLTPRILSSSESSWSYLRKGAKTCLNPSSSLPLNVDVASENYKCTSRDTSPQQDKDFQIPRPLHREGWSKGKDCFLVTDKWGTIVGSSVSTTPVVLLRQSDERMFLLAYQHKNLTVIFLISVTSLISGEQGLPLLKQQFLENASLNVSKVENMLSSGWGGENMYHVRGYRYLQFDNDKNTSRASPPGKVTTLTKDSLLALNTLRERIDIEKSRAAKSNSDNVKDLEVCVRAYNNAWMVARLTRGRELYMVLEKARETLLYASDAVEKFSERYCDGAFSIG